MKIWRKRLTYLLTELINDEAVYRTAPATPGLLNMKMKERIKCIQPAYYAADKENRGYDEGMAPPWLIGNL